MDAFAEFNLPRSAALDREALGRRFDELSRERHPDAGGDTAAFACLTQARKTLELTSRRLRHLLELEFPGSKIDGPMNPALPDLFGRLGPILQDTAAVTKKSQQAASSLAKALLANDEMRMRESLEEFATELDGRLNELEASLINWDGAAGTLAAAAREAAFLEKWQAQVREQLLRLAQL